MARSPKVDEALRTSRRWREETKELRQILLGCGLREDLKWRMPCYSHAGKNICILQNMKGFLALMFFKGSLLKDPEGILEKQGPNSRSACRMRFTSVEDVARMASSIKAYVPEAIEIERAGIKVARNEPKHSEYPAELIHLLEIDPEFKGAFQRLTPGRRRGYVLHFAAAKRSSTRAARLQRCRPKILRGKGLQER